MAATIRGLARMTGFSTATVSLALRGSPKISEPTRETVRKAARRVGYAPLPLLSRALSLARQPDARRFRETLAVVAESPAPSFQQELFAFARDRAAATGYRLELFPLGSSKAAHRHLARVLRARGIRGAVILPRVRALHARLHLDWNDLAAVEIGRTLWFPGNLHKVERPIYYELLDAFHRLKKAGFRRVALAVQPAEEAMRRGVYGAAYSQAGRRIPPFADAGAWTFEAFRKWFRAHRPDVVVVFEAEPVSGWLARMGLSAPRDVGLFCANAGGSGAAGLRSDPRGLAESAVDMLALLLERNETGLPSKPRVWLVEDDFQQGATLGVSF